MSSSQKDQDKSFEVSRFDHIYSSNKILDLKKKFSRKFQIFHDLNLEIEGEGKLHGRALNKARFLTALPLDGFVMPS